MPDTRAPTVPQFTRRLGIETPEHLVLELELAGLGSRMAATVCDAGLLVLAFVLLGVGIQLLPTPTGGDAEGPWSSLARSAACSTSCSSGSKASRARCGTDSRPSSWLGSRRDSRGGTPIPRPSWCSCTAPSWPSAGGASPPGARRG